ncbi:MAG: hypothetical protein CMF50_04380 [Legionellales bacterium]|nr:hypothetical protein [Legionellales bacterium]|tara:strand:+ start:8907 stop:9530 length:624 start_codon:yes stop_codon:yes gene_type:complete
MNLSHEQIDVLKEVTNISASRAAKQLSALLDDEIIMEIEDIELLNQKQCYQLMSHDHTNASCISQQFDGGLAGSAILLFPNEDSKLLLGSLIGKLDTIGGQDLRVLEHEAMSEIGNVIITSSISSFADLINVELDISIPQYSEGEFGAILQDKEQQSPGDETVILLIKTRLQARNHNIAGVLIVMFSVSSAEALFSALQPSGINIVE